MSTTTPFLGLVLYDSTTDQVVTFATFRAVWGGIATSSNFYKIDTAYGALDTRVDSLEVTRGAIPVPAVFVSANFYSVSGISTITAYNAGMTIILSVDTTSSGTVTLDINSLGTKSVMKVDSTGTAINLTGSDLVKGRQYLFIYDGTRWLWVSANSADQIQIVGTAGNVVTVGSTNNLLGTTTQAGLIADTTHAATVKSSVADADEFPIADSAASYVLKRITALTLKLAVWSGIKPVEGTMWNGKLSVTVSSNNITVALKTLGGANPSATDPVYITLGATVRTVTAALSVTKNAGTNWFNAGSAELATKEIDYFAYLGYNATDGVVIGFARIPYAKQYGTFSATTTNEKYAGISTITTAASTDFYSVIGRFAATLSAGAGYTWSVPSYNPSNLIQAPIYTTRWLSWTPVWTASGSLTYTSVTNTHAKYIINDDTLDFKVRVTGTLGGTASTTLFATKPFEATLLADSPAVGSGITAGAAGTAFVTAASSLLSFIKYDNSNYATSGSNVVNMLGAYEID